MWGLIIGLIVLLVIVIAGYYLVTQVAKDGKGILCNIPLIGGLICPGAGAGTIPDCTGKSGSDLTTCCTPVVKDCKSNCSLNTDPNACLVACTKKRGCDSALSCSDFGTYSAGTGNQCGNDNQGGSTCKTACCAAQVKFCEDAPDNKSKVKCLTDRGCSASDLSCSDFGTYGVNTGDPTTFCGTDGQGGSSCKTACCAAQVKFCEDAPDNKSKVACMTQRGCSANDLSCSDFGTFGVNTGDPSTFCGTDGQGGSHCKTACCDTQNGYCNDNCKPPLDAPGCWTKCMAQRGCSKSETFHAGSPAQVKFRTVCRRVRVGFGRMGLGRR